MASLLRWRGTGHGLDESPTTVERLAPTTRLVDFHTGRLEKSLLGDLHDEKKMQKKLYDTIAESDEPARAIRLTRLSGAS